MVKYFPYYFPRLVTNELNAQVSDTTDDATCTEADKQKSNLHIKNFNPLRKA